MRSLLLCVAGVACVALALGDRGSVRSSYADVIRTVHVDTTAGVARTLASMDMQVNPKLHEYTCGPYFKGSYAGKQFDPNKGILEFAFQQKFVDQDSIPVEMDDAVRGVRNDKVGVRLDETAVVPRIIRLVAGDQVSYEISISSTDLREASCLTYLVRS